MPVRPDLIYLYTSELWTEVRNRIRKRSGGRFENGEYSGGAHCEDCDLVDGERFKSRAGAWVKTQIQISHLDHEDLTRFYDEDNLKARCGRCHLKADAPVHRASRSIRKDRKRPLLMEVGNAATPA